MSSFDVLLKSWCNTPSGPYRRPFAPNPQWSRAQVFIIGTNPATPMRDEFCSFNEYWKGLTHTPELFYRHYATKHAGGVSKSSGWTRDFLALLAPLNCLVTNVAWYPARRPSGVPVGEWEFGHKALASLIEQCKPAAIFCHGSVAEGFARTWGADVDRYVPASEQNCIVRETLVLAFHHLSGQGLRKGARFQPGSELPAFAQRILAHAREA